VQHSARLLLGRGVNPKASSEMLGHAPIGGTDGICSQVPSDVQE
jgi:hypothetical protein